MTDENEGLLMLLTDSALRVSESYGDLIQDDSALENMKRQALFTADAVHIAEQLLAVINDIDIRQERRMRGEMIDHDLSEAINAMMPNAYNVIGYHNLLEAERGEGEKLNPIQRVAFEAHAAAGGHALATQVFQLSQQLKERGIIPW